jgi:aspartate/methionine/tyrosine aminotransferase
VKNLTELEIAALDQYHNLADGHAVRSWSLGEQRVVDRAATLLCPTDRERQRAIEHKYLRSFLQLAGQTPPCGAVCFFCFTASSAIEAIANLLRLRGDSVALVEPCFDNLSDILRRHRVPLRPLDDALYTTPSEFVDTLARQRPSAVFVVSPNNPTGRHLDATAFAVLIDYCKRSRAVLIVDACFRFYVPRKERYDQYAMLANSDIDWILIEDTGKTWPTAEIKAPFFMVSSGLAPTMAHIYSDFLLHVSPFALRLLEGFIVAAIEDDLFAVTQPIAENRQVLLDALRDAPLIEAGVGALSVAWLEITDGIAAATLVNRLADGGVHVLPGGQFFWHDPGRGSHHVRVALARDPQRFREAARRISDMCRSSSRLRVQS